MFQDGLVVCVVGFFVVFLGMFMIMSVVIWMRNISISRVQKKVSSKEKPITKQEIKTPTEVYTAISMALYLNKFLKEEDHHTITIQKSTIPFSPWVTKGRNSIVTQNNTFYGRRK